MEDMVQGLVVLVVVVVPEELEVLVVEVLVVEVVFEEVI